MERHFNGWTFREPTGELLKGDRRVVLQSQPLTILRLLLRHPGELVSRTSLIEALWPGGVVDYETALNSAVRRLRLALGDNADDPRYVETIPKRGYRFVAALTTVVPPAPVADVRLANGHGAASRARQVTRYVLAAACALLLLWPGLPAVQWEPAAPSSERLAQERVQLARHFLRRRTADDLVTARRYLDEALTLEPRAADALAALASVAWIETVEGRLPATEGFAQVKEAAERAIAVDPSSAEATVRLANYHAQVGNNDIAAALIQRAIRMTPEDSLVLSIIAAEVAASGDLNRAIELQKRSVQNDPLYLPSRWNLASWLYLAGRLDEARMELLRLRELNATDIRLPVRLADLHLLTGEYAEALGLADELTEPADRHFVSALAYRGLGRESQAEEALRLLMATAGPTQPHRIAEALASLGSTDLAFEWLTLAAGDGQDRWIAHSPFLASLHDDRRWDGLLDAAGLL